MIAAHIVSLSAKLLVVLATAMWAVGIIDTSDSKFSSYAMALDQKVCRIYIGIVLTY